jgi:hypothetical protein
MNERLDDLRRELTRESEDDKGLRGLLLHGRENL